MNKFCGNCGAPRVGTGNFCGGCGTRYPDDGPALCPTCGQQLPVGMTLNALPPTQPAPAPVIDLKARLVSSPAGLMYGPDFVPETDCWNCGNPDVPAGQQCPLCEAQA